MQLDCRKRVQPEVPDTSANANMLHILTIMSVKNDIYVLDTSTNVNMLHKKDILMPYFVSIRV